MMMNLLFYLYLIASASSLSSVSNFRHKKTQYNKNYHIHWTPIQEDSSLNFFTPSYSVVEWRNWRHEKLDFWKSGPAQTSLNNKQHWDTGILTANITHTLNPSLVVELGQPEKCVRLSSTSKGPFLWYRVELGWYGCHFVRRSLDDLNVLPKIKSGDIEEYREAIASKSSEQDDTPAFYEFWAKRFADALSTSSTCNPLTKGFCQLAPRTFSPKLVETIVQQQFHSGHIDFDHPGFGALALRKLSHPDSGRVQWWRKKAREGVLPPILLWKFSGLGENLVLDGHDRLLAASLEHQPIHAICLVRRTMDAVWDPRYIDPNRRSRLQQEAHELLDWDYRVPEDQQAMRTEIANRLLSEAHAPRLFEADSNNMVGSMSVEEWKDEVSDQLAKAYGSNINFDDHYKDIFVQWGQAEDNAFWKPLIDEIPHRHLAKIWKD